MSHLAAIIPQAKAPLEVQEVNTVQPGPHEILVKNELIALQPIDAKIAKWAIFPVSYPAILGSSFGGYVVSVGSNVATFKVGDKVAVANTGSFGKFSAFQQLVIARDITASKIPESVDLAIPVSLIGNLATVVGLFTAHLGLERPKIDGVAPPQGKKVLIYGGSSSVGSLAVQYVTQGGYNVVTTTSPKHRSFVSKLGAVGVIDHSQDQVAVVRALSAAGPFHLIVDSISTLDTLKITAEVVLAQGGGKLQTMLPAFGPETLPRGVTREFSSWSVALADENHRELLIWAFETYLPLAVASGKIVSLPVEKVAGGLGALNHALRRLIQGVSGVKIAVEPFLTTHERGH